MIEAQCVWILTPDGDVYIEEMAVPPFRSLAVAGERGALNRYAKTVGIGKSLGQVYDFDEERPAGPPWTLTLCRAIEATRIENEPDDVSPESVVKCSRGTLPTKTWRVLYRRGAEDVVGQPLTLGSASWAEVAKCVVVNRGIGLVVASSETAVNGQDALLNASATEAVEVEPEGDARIMPVLTVGGRRHRSFREGVAMIKESEWSHWPVSGPRTLAWCARFIVENYESPKSRHLAWRTQCGLTEKDDGVDTHETAMRFLESLICFDRCQAAELASAELIVRGAVLNLLNFVIVRRWCR